MVVAILAHVQRICDAIEVRDVHRRFRFVLGTIAIEECAKGMAFLLYSCHVLSPEEMAQAYRRGGPLQDHRFRQKMAAAFLSSLELLVKTRPIPKPLPHYAAMNAARHVAERIHRDSDLRRALDPAAWRDWEWRKQQALYVDWYENSGIPGDPVRSEDMAAVRRVARQYLLILRSAASSPQRRAIERHGAEFRALLHLDDLK